MKRFTWFAVLCVAVLLIAVPAMSQINVNSVGVKFSNYAYANSANDTSSSQSVAGASKLALWVKTTDSASIDVYVQYKDSNATWTTKLTDSLITTVNTGKVQEYSLIDADSDVFDAFIYGVRVILAARASGNGVTAPVFSAKYYYRP